ncbi:hypothetical protein DUNSADRAFT_9470 [Dunaliella salina]|uniref:Uncharacterized protein n=1 Tax=Dunaliella salina TaxID=3046 RepID=A0ABQ7GHF9_DUNSA|nr:hypothetical protein DUNSADRAFT_9470 [Dunaliella salina]|eukprot:KAF5834031.1 hypothetical protein DUNSADRAFT_9470 [Dunaliella salina]
MLPRQWYSVQGECASTSTSRCSSSLTSRPSPLHHTRSRKHVTVRSISSEDIPPEKQAILDRINKAKAYKQGAAAPASSSSPGAPPPPPPPRKQPEWEAMTAFLGGPSSTAGSGTQGNTSPSTMPIDAQQQQLLTEEQRRAEAERQRRFAEANKAGSKEAMPPDENLVGVIQSANIGPGRGSAYQPAEALRGALQESTLLEGIDTSNMKMSEITELKEARRRALGAELIVADEAYRPTSKSDKGRIGSPQPSNIEAMQGNQQSQGGSGDPPSADQPLYAPKVSTWGLFPRPSNISSAYGGGRTIRPGDPIEDPEQAAKRRQASNEALARYKRKMGLEVDERVEAEADALYRQGMERFNKGNLEAALMKFDEAASKVQVRTKVGGFVTLQRALVLDSLGNRDEAQKLYKQVRGHAVTEVSRRAKQMMFGFEAATFLKADQFSYGVRKGDYDPYFRRIIDKNKVYVPTPEEREADKRGELVAAVTAVMVITFPFGLAAALARSAGAL